MLSDLASKWKHQGVATKPMTDIRHVFPVFHQSPVILLHVMFIFGGCRQSLARAIPVKYKRHPFDLTHPFA